MSAVSLVDVGPRDGLQNAARVLSPDLRAELCVRIAAAGLERIEAVSFVHPDRVPPMAGAERVAELLPPPVRDRCCGLVLNERGYDRLLASGLRELRYAFAVSDEFNQRNSNASTASGLATARRIIARAREDGMRTGVVLVTAFGCPFAGEIDPGEVLALADVLVAEGVSELVFADTIGVAAPGQVRSLLEAWNPPPGVTVGAHFHNTRSSGYANAYAALEAGARTLDVALGGLGGCPFAPGASGNIATEDVVYMLERDGIATGADLDALVETAHWLGVESGFQLDGQLHRVAAFPPRLSAQTPR